MQFHFDEEKRLFQQSAREFFEGECTAERVRELWDGETGHSPELWNKLAELGLLGVLVPEDHGGLGLDETDFVLLLEEAGRAALPLPLAETAAVAAPLLRDLALSAAEGAHRKAGGSSDVAAGVPVGDPTLEGAGGPAPADSPDTHLGGVAEKAGAWLERIAGGRAIVAIAAEAEPLVVAANVADAFIVERDGNLYLTDAAAVRITAQPGLDPSRRLFSVEYVPKAEERVAEGEKARALIAAAFDRAALAAAAQMVGAGQRMIDMAVAYACEREQFGQPIGAFQAVKHMLASAQVRVEFARPVLYRAASSVATGDARRSLHVSHAKAAASEAALTAARAALQVHGAIGYTWECDLQIWMKRVWALEAAWGTMLWHRRRIGKVLLEGSEPPPSFGFAPRG